MNQRAEERSEAQTERFPIVGVGASAGGLEAFAALLDNLPARPGMGLVFVPHLDPHHKSLLVELLAKHTDMPVDQATTGVKVEPNRIYIIPPNKNMAIEDGRLRLQTPVEPRGHRFAIDFFLRSLAEDQGERAIGVVLSGTGSDGTLGLKAIRGAGGLTLTQEPTSAKYEGMPRSAVFADVVDEVLAVERIAKRLVDFASHPAALRKQEPAHPEDAPDHVGAIFGMLHALTRHDFTHYKRATVMRRIERRMQVLNLRALDAYVRQLQAEPGELRLLFKDLLIGVTNFFRGPEAFAALDREVLTPLIQDRPTEEELRIWVPGCATGEEAYSIAILVTERAEALGQGIRVKIFATDIDVDALEVARQGSYPETIAADVSAERLERFFVHENGTYTPNGYLREKVVFAPQNLIADPPFSKLDLVSCRNLLIYLDGFLQERVIPVFHYALKPGAYLFLGASEGIGSASDLFKTVDRKWKIYRRRAASVSRPLELPSFARVTPSPIEPPRQEPDLATTLDTELVRHYAPGCAALVTDRGDIVQLRGQPSRFLAIPEGRPTLNALRMAPDGLRVDLRAMLHQALRTDSVVERRASLSEGDGGRREVDVAVRPLAEIAGFERLSLVTFDEVPPPPEVQPEPAPSEATPGEVDRLRSELAATKEYLQTTIEELETSNEELTSSNEELLSMNEELQSTNEELETSKEELQSVNEELTTVNVQLNQRVTELTHAQDDINNLLASTDVATLFLDHDLAVTRYTPQVADVLNLQSSDVGRPISHITSRLQDFDLVTEAGAVLDEAESSERQVESGGGGVYLVRTSPYRRADGEIDGVVITFVEVTHYVRSKRELERALDRVREFEFALDRATVVMITDSSGRITHVNDTLCELSGYSREELIGQNPRILNSGHHPEEFFAKLWKTILAGEIWRGLIRNRTKTGEAFWLETVIVPLASADGEPDRFLTIRQDVTERVRMRSELERSERLFRAVFDSAGIGIAVVDLDDHMVEVNPPLCRMLGYSAEDLVGQRFTGFVFEEDGDPERELFDALVRGERDRYEITRRYRAGDGSERWACTTVSSLRDGAREPRYVLGVIRDVTEARKAERRMASQAALAKLGEMAAVVAHEVKNPLAGIGGALHMIASRFEPDTPELDVVQRIRQRLDSLDAIVDDLLIFARPADPQLEQLDLRALLEETTELLTYDEQTTDVKVAIEGEPIRVWGDRALLRQVFFNLYTNAAQAMHGGGRVRVSVEIDEPWCVVRVADKGPGVPTELRESVFEPFFTTRARGTGLGLPIARRIIEAHGGEIGLECPAAGGSIFVVRLPLTSRSSQVA